MKKLIVVLALIFIIGCSDDNAKIQTAPPAIDITQSNRFKVEAYQQISDDTTYKYSRAVLVILDTKTGKEYLAIGGAGVIEMGSHLSGKTVITDER